MCRGLSGADDTPGLVAGFMIETREGVSHYHDNVPDRPDCLPSLFVRMRLLARGRQWIIEHELRCLEIQTMLSPVGEVLSVVPCPAQGGGVPVVAFL